MINKTTKIVFSLFLFLLPLYTLPLGSANTPVDKHMLLVTAASVLFLLTVLRVLSEKKLTLVKTPANLYLTVLTLLFVASTVVGAPNKMNAFYQPLSTGTLIALFLLFLTLTQNTISLLPLVLGTAVAALVTFLQQFKLFPGFFPLEGTLSATVFYLVVSVLLISEIVMKKFFPELLGHDAKGEKEFGFAGLLKGVGTLVISVTGLVSLYHLLTDQKPLLLPFQAGWIILMEMYKNIQVALLGVSPANFPFAYSLAKPAALNLTPFWSLVMGSSSNYLLTLATEVGLAAAVIFILLTIRVLRFPDFPDFKNSAKPVLIALAVLLVAEIVLPASVSLLTLTFILLGIAAPKTKARVVSLAGMRNASILFVIGLIPVVYLVLIQSRVYLSDMYFRQALSLAQNQKANEAYDFTVKAVMLNPDSDNYLSLASSLEVSLARSVASGSKPENASESAKQANLLTQAAVNDARRATTLNPLSAGNWGQLSSIYQMLIGGMQGADQLALESLNQQMNLDPSSPQPKMVAGNIMMSAKQYREAEALFLQAANLKPDWNVPYYSLASLYKVNKAYPQAAQALQKTIELTSPESEDYKKLTAELEEIKPLLPKEGETASPTPSPKKAK